MNKNVTVPTIRNNFINTNTVVSNVRNDVTNTSVVVSDIHSDALKRNQDQTVSTIRNLPITE